MNDLLTVTLILDAVILATLAVLWPLVGRGWAGLIAGGVGIAGVILAALLMASAT